MPAMFRDVALDLGISKAFKDAAFVVSRSASAWRLSRGETPHPPVPTPSYLWNSAGPVSTVDDRAGGDVGKYPTSRAVHTRLPVRLRSSATARPTSSRFASAPR